MNGQRELRAFEGGKTREEDDSRKGGSSSSLFACDWPKISRVWGPLRAGCSSFFSQFPAEGTFGPGAVVIQPGGTCPGIKAKLEAGQCEGYLEGGQELGNCWHLGFLYRWPVGYCIWVLWCLGTWILPRFQGPRAPGFNIPMYIPALNSTADCLVHGLAALMTARTVRAIAAESGSKNAQAGQVVPKNQWLVTSKDFSICVFQNTSTAREDAMYV